ncbi:protein PLASTID TRANSCRIPTIONALLY ACTIVE 16, chloroplastic [Nicotiana tomentosiformis]|uniref:Protein plastid transcriptionally active 16, chloroplastic n=1 Tax=Nicotiana tabacum TaxID=4097 RepID=A0A1S3ZW63_TOBAC|nr:protein PLASTID TRANSCRIPTIONALLY ACTIVE 16, chloroplastic [Nicotiana tomentosiformis]XP_016468665.1 PREDICTED: protein plastid transcriptionally active 16, chloroplastic-like [Nicotiana tabacum]
MAPTLTSNSFLLTTTPHPRLSFKNSRFTVFAKKSGPFPSFRLGKSAESSNEENQETTTSNSSIPFSFDFGKLPDVKSLIPVSTNPSSGLAFGRQRAKDPGTVFVAGATGQAGVRIAQTLLREGFSVRAGVSDLGAAQELAQLAVSYKVISNDESKRLNAVASTFQDAESIAKAIGNASKVVVTIGKGEDGPTTEVTTTDAVQVIQAAQLAGVGHVAIVYDESSSIGSTYNVLDGITSFFNNLFSKSQPLTISEFLQKIVETDVSYTLIKTSLTEDFSPESSYNIVVSAEGSAGENAYKVAKSEIAKLVVDVFSNTAVAENKVVEVFTDPSASKKTVDELFSTIPVDGRRKAYAEALEKSKAEEEARQAAEASKRQEEEAKKLVKKEAKAANVAKEAEEKDSSAAGPSVESLLDKAKGLSIGFSIEKFSSQLKSAVEKVGEESTQVATVRGQAKARNLPAQKAVIKTPPRKPFASKKNEAPKPTKQTETKTETRKVFGGLFQQETIYVDD